MAEASASVDVPMEDAAAAPPPVSYILSTVNEWTNEPGSSHQRATMIYERILVMELS